MKKVAFAPIVNSNSSVLFLGTMPSEESLRKQEYYGNKNNQFWKILFTLYNQPLPSEYKLREELLRNNGIALWDVLQSCEGIGSLDSAIKNEKPNNFNIFYKQYPRIKYIFFTSKKAADFYKKYVGFDEDKTFAILPSPSTANARMSLEEKTITWRNILESILSL